MHNYYDPEDTRQAAILFAQVADKYKGNNNYEYDLVDICRQALADQGRKQYLLTIADYNAFARKDFDKNADRFLKMILLQDKLLGTRSEFRLGHWTEQARKSARLRQRKTNMNGMLVYRLPHGETAPVLIREGSETMHIRNGKVY